AAAVRDHRPGRAGQRVGGAEEAVPRRGAQAARGAGAVAGQAAALAALAGAGAPTGATGFRRRWRLRRLRWLWADAARETLSSDAAAGLDPAAFNGLRREAMMRFLVGLLVLLAVAGGIYQWGGNSLDEKQVRDYYRGVEQATLAFDDALLCGMLA